jgi:CRP-like cAMP-binding protein
MLGDLHARQRSFPAGRDMVHKGQKDQTAFILTKGWVCSCKLLSGGTRQIVDFQVPGDFPGLRSVLLRTADPNIEPVTKVAAAEVHVSDLPGAFTHIPRLATVVLWAASRDAARLVEHLAGLGRRNAAERTGHFLLELAARLRLVGLGDTAGLDCPVSQYLMADALGPSAVHVNSVLC